MGRMMGPFLGVPSPPGTLSWHLFSSCLSPEQCGILSGESRLIHFEICINKFASKEQSSVGRAC